MGVTNCFEKKTTFGTGVHSLGAFDSLLAGRRVEGDLPSSIREEN